jgi:hypothetical protein
MKEVKITLSIHVPVKKYKKILEQINLYLSIFKISIESQSRKIDFDIRTQIKDLK